MAAAQPLSMMTGINFSMLSLHEFKILEANFFLHLCKSLKIIYQEKNRDFFRLINCSRQMEEDMLEDNFARCVINDILLSEEYTLTGIACYTQTPEEVVYDIAYGLNTSPSARFIRRIIELHKMVRKDLYCQIIQKINPQDTLK